MTVFELQVDPERNAIIRRALAKRIVQQREEEEEEASTEEDESFLGNSIAIVRSAPNGPSPSPLLPDSPSKGHRHHHHNGHHGHHHHHHHHHHGHQRAVSGAHSVPDGERMNARSRWKIEYLRTKSSSPAGSVVDALVETLPDLLKGGDVGDTNNISNQDTPTAQPTLEDTISVAPAGPQVEDVTMEEHLPITTTTTTTTTTTIVVNTSEETRPQQEPAVPATEEGALVEDKLDIDPIEQDILLQLEELKKEKSRLFALFRNTLQKKEQEPSSVPPPRIEALPPSTSSASAPPLDIPPQLPQPPQFPQPPPLPQPPQLPLLPPMPQLPQLPQLPQPPQAEEGRHARFSSSASEASTRIMPMDRPFRDSKVAARLALEKSKEESRRAENLRKSVDQGHDRRTDPPRPNIKRREHERIIDRSKLNLEIPRKPTLSNSSSNSTSSTPTNSFASPPSSAGATMMKPKRQRSISPIGEEGASNSNYHRGSGAGSFGPMCSSSSSYSESSASNKYPRADLLGSHASRHGLGSGSGSNINHGNSNSNSISNTHHHHNNNGLPEKPQVRHHHHGGPSASSSSARSLGVDSYHGDDGYHRSKGGNGPSSLMSSGMNGSGGGSGGGGGSYRQQGSGSLGYHHSQGAPPPTRIGFGNNNNSSNSSNINSNNNSGGNSGGGGSGTGSNAVGTGNNGRGAGGYYGHNDGPPPPISMLGPPGGRPLSFNRHMMQMPHARGGMLRNRPGFGGGGSGRGNGGGGGNSGGPPDRSMSSGRPGEWSRRRSRA